MGYVLDIGAKMTDHLDYKPCRPLSKLPLKEGYRFIGIGHKSESIPCSIWKGFVTVDATTEVLPNAEYLLKGWRKRPWWRLMFV